MWIELDVFDRKFENIHCRAISVVLLAILMGFLGQYCVDAILSKFGWNAYTLIPVRTVPYALLVLVVVIFCRIEGQELTPEVVGLTLPDSRESRIQVVQFVVTLTIIGIGMLAFFCFMKFYRGIDVSRIVAYPLSLPYWIEKADLDGLGTLFLLVIPHSVGLLLITPLVEEVYYTGLIFPALRNRLGFVAGLIELLSNVVDSRAPCTM